MKTKVRIDFISDVVCPWCAIGYKRLERAISELDLQDRVEIVWHPFFLNPDMADEGENINDYGARKYGRSREESDSNLAYIASQGDSIGFAFSFTDDSRVVNTRNAHALLDYAKESGKQTELKARLFEAFFSEQKDISDRSVLKRELQTLGINASRMNDILNDSETHKRISEEATHWTSRGIFSVPTMIFDGETAINGSQSVETYKQILKELN